MTRGIRFHDTDVETIPQMIIIGAVFCYGTILAVSKLLETVDINRALTDANSIDIERELWFLGE